jgi:uncharacterized protein
MYIDPKKFHLHNPLIILQPTPFCNLDCKYCYLPNRNSKEEMSLEVLEQIFNEVLKSSLPDPIEFVWHAGEPLSVSKLFYRNAFELLNQINLQYKRKLKHGIQTNGTLIDEEWIGIFQDNNIHIGVSVDGPEFIHDCYRVTKTGYGTHKKTMRGVELLQKNQIPFSTISVLTNFTLDYPDKFFSFFVEHQIGHIALNIDEISGYNSSSSYQIDQSMYRYKKFMTRLLELVDKNNGFPRVREFVRVASVIKNNPHQAGVFVNSTNTPLHILTFDYKGNFTTFCPELVGTESQEYNNFIMGNIVNNSINSIWDNLIFRKVYTEIKSGLETCKNSCDYWHFCGGGSPSNKFSETGKFNNNLGVIPRPLGRKI